MKIPSSPSHSITRAQFISSIIFRFIPSTSGLFDIISITYIYIYYSSISLCTSVGTVLYYLLDGPETCGMSLVYRERTEISNALFPKLLVKSSGRSETTISKIIMREEYIPGGHLSRATRNITCSYWFFNFMTSFWVLDIGTHRKKIGSSYLRHLKAQCGKIGIEEVIQPRSLVPKWEVSKK